MHCFARASSDIYKIETSTDDIGWSFLMMTIETLGYYLSRVGCGESTYIGRLLEWPGVTYAPFRVTLYIFPREFFKHYDGYGHVTGMRLISDIRQSQSLVLRFPNNGDEKKVVEFYYQRWLDCYLLFLRSALSQNSPRVASMKDVFRKSIERSLSIFRRGYLDRDVVAGLISPQQVNVIEGALKSHIYYYGNNLFQTVMTEIHLMEDGEFVEFKKKIKGAFRMIAPSWFLKFYRLLRRIL